MVRNPRVQSQVILQAAWRDPSPHTHTKERKRKWRLSLVERKLHWESAAQNPGFQFCSFGSEAVWYEVKFLQEFPFSWNTTHSPALDPSGRQWLSECSECLFWFKCALLFQHSYRAVKSPPLWEIFITMWFLPPQQARQKYDHVWSLLREVHRNEMTCATVVRLLGGKGENYGGMRVSFLKVSSTLLL